MIAGEPALRQEARYILTEVMLRGEVSRGEAKRVTGLGDRTARKVVSQLEEEELITSENHRSPLRFNIPAKVVGYYFPNLYPEGTFKLGVNRCHSNIKNSTAGTGSPQPRIVYFGLFACQS